MTGIGQRLKRERTRLKLSQSVLGAIGGVETNAQGNYESGVRSPRADYLSRIANVGIDVTYVVTGVSTSAPEPALPAAVNGAEFNELNALNTEQLAAVIARLHVSLHDITDALYQMTLLIEATTDQRRGPALQAQLDVIKADAEAIALATVRLIFVTSKLN